MKKLVLGAAFAPLASAAVAGSVAPPIVEDVVIVEQTATSSVSHDFLPPLMFLISVASAVWML